MISQAAPNYGGHADDNKLLVFTCHQRPGDGDPSRVGASPAGAGGARNRAGYLERLPT